MQASEKERKKRLKNGSYSSVITAIVVVALVIVNFIVAGLPTTVTKADFSEQQMLSLSEQTKEITQALSEKITIYEVAQQGKEDNILQELVEKYAALSDNITVEAIDTALYPTFASQYTTEGLADNSLIVESAKRFKVIPYDEIYVAETGTNEEGQQVQSTTFDGENQLTNAIDFVTSDTLPVAYAVSGHSETAIPDALTTQIANQNIEVQTLDLVQAEELPKDCSALIFYAPLKDITEKEAKLLEEFLNNGGGVYLVTTWQAGSLPHLEGLLEKFGVSIGDGMVMEGDTGYTNQNAPYIIFAQLDSHAITDPLIESGLNVLVAQAQPLSFDTTVSGVTGSRLLTTTGKGYVKSISDINSQKFAKEDEKSTTQTIYGVVEKDNGNAKSGKLAVCTTPMMFDNESNNYSAGGNYDLVLNTIGWMCEHESAISIHSKSMDGSALQVSSAQTNIWSAVLVVVIPIALLVAGIVVWIVRRRR